MTGPDSRTTVGKRLLCLAAMTGLAAGGASVQLGAQESGVATPVTDANGASLGSVALPGACAPEATVHLGRGLALLHNMTYGEAASEFDRARERDPECALAYWGRAMTFVHPLWPDVPPDELLARGRALLAEGREKGAPDDHEAAYIAALEAYYRNGSERSESERLASFAEGWQRARSAYPDDPEIQLFHALSLIAVAGSVDARAEAGRMAEAVLERIPDHPGAHHYTIHAYDLPQLAEGALPAAHSYGEVAPDNSHALHMTSHIFTRTGLWEESIEYNRRAADAALRHPIGGRLSFHYLHAADYLVYAHLQRGDAEAARAVWEEVRSRQGPAVDNVGSAYAYAAVPVRIALERERWEEARALEPRRPSDLSWDRYPHLEAITRFARGLGAARTGRVEVAEEAADRLADLAARAAELPEAYDWATLVRAQELGVRAWTARARGDADRALELMRRAAELEAGTQKNPVTPSEVLPAAELLGDLLLEMGRHEAARTAYDAALDRSPNRLRSLLGAGRALEAAGDEEGARDYYRRAVEGRVEAADHEGLRHARGMVGGG